MVIFSANGYQVATTYGTDGSFIETNGGAWRLDGNNITEVIEFDTQTPDRVGTEVTFEIDLDGNSLTVKDGPTWTRIDDGAPGELAGAWLFHGRKMDDGTLALREMSGPRKTMKILSGTRFQWIAYNTETKEFFGTGGGTYTTIEGKYTENIEFFSRDISRVGASLQFDFSLQDGLWHHSGLNSRGEPLYEVWKQRTP